MKRSEFLKLIELVISPCNSTFPKDRKNAAERVLQVCETVMIKPKFHYFETNSFHDTFEVFENMDGVNCWDMEE